MKDWRIRQDAAFPLEPDLVHIHPEDHVDPGEWLCYRAENGTWWCEMCNADAPEEICFVAELAGCWEG